MAAVALAIGSVSIGWLNPKADRAREGNALFHAGKYDDAVAKYGEALIDEPESPLLNFNMATAHYKAGHYEKAIDSFQRVRAPETDKTLAGNTALGIGSAYFRMAEAAESSKPQDALKQYAAALVAYRRGLGIDHTARGAKLGYEATLRRIEALQKKIEEQKKQQEEKKKQQEQEQNQSQEPPPKQDQPDQKQEDGQDKQDQQQQDQQQQDQQQAQDKQQQDQQQQGGEQGKEDDKQKQKQDQEEQKQQQAGDEKPQDDKQAQKDQQQAGGEGGEESGDEAADAGGEASETGEPKDGMSKREAAALLDSARSEELQPDEFVKHAAPARVAEPSRDW